MASLHAAPSSAAGPGPQHRRGLAVAPPGATAPPSTESPWHLSDQPVAPRTWQGAAVHGGLLDFTGTVDFSPERIVVPGPDAFPPARVQAGAIGDDDYSPLVTPDGRVVLNATHVANASGLHDAVRAIDLAARMVTLDTLNGFYDESRVQYLHQEASVELVAALEGSTWAPNLDAAPGVGVFDSRTSARGRHHSRRQRPCGCETTLSDRVCGQPSSVKATRSTSRRSSRVRAATRPCGT